MTTVLVDSNVILDVLTDDPAWGDWSAQHLATCADQGAIAINPIIAVSGLRLLTRDAARYRTYFPKLQMICPA